MSFKERLFGKWLSLRNLFLWGNISLFLLFLVVMAQDQKRSWKDYQKEFQEREIARAKEHLSKAASEDEKSVAAGELKLAKASKTEIRQIWAQKLNAVDRCITCHLGYDALSNASLVTP